MRNFKTIWQLFHALRLLKMLAICEGDTRRTWSILSIFAPNLVHIEILGFAKFQLSESLSNKISCNLEFQVLRRHKFSLQNIFNAGPHDIAIAVPLDIQYFEGLKHNSLSNWLYCCNVFLICVEIFNSSLILGILKTLSLIGAQICSSKFYSLAEFYTKFTLPSSV